MKKKFIWKHLTNNKIRLLLWGLLPFIAYGQAKTPVPYKPAKNYFFPKSTVNNLIDNAQTMYPFFEQLNNLLHYPENFQTISIVHIGDSHIQADFQTNVTRQLFQQYFGSAGRGFITPLKLTKTNEPPNYSITSPQHWNYAKCIKESEIPVGIGGLVIFRQDSTADIRVETHDNHDPVHWDFNQITAFYDTNHTQVLPTDSTQIKYRNELNNYSNMWQLDTLTTSISMRFHTVETNTISLYGFNLQNNKNGILYHSIGINGARYENFNNIPLFYEQLPLLKASLIIVSLGTNEAYNEKFNVTKFYNSIDNTIKQIRHACPQAVILLTTPAETWMRYKSKYRKPNPNMSIVSDVIVKYAEEHHIACWNLFAVTGGKGSSHSWRKNNLLYRDGIHFNRAGYEYIGNLLFQAVYNTYLNTELPCSTSISTN